MNLERTQFTTLSLLLFLISTSAITETNFIIKTFLMIMSFRLVKSSYFSPWLIITVKTHTHTHTHTQNNDSFFDS